MRQLKAWCAALVMSSVVLGGTGCGIKEYFNCRDLCDKKKECGSDSSYDVSHCVDVCSDSANQSSDFARKVDTCKECESGVSCMDYKNQAGCLAVCPSLP